MKECGGEGIASIICRNMEGCLAMDDLIQPWREVLPKESDIREHYAGCANLEKVLAKLREMQQAREGKSTPED